MTYIKRAISEILINRVKTSKCRVSVCELCGLSLREIKQIDYNK